MKKVKQRIASLLLVTTLVTSLPLDVTANQNESVTSTEIQEIVESTEEFLEQEREENVVFDAVETEWNEETENTELVETREEVRETDSIEVTESTEIIKSTENVENTECTEAVEDIEATEIIDSTQASENAETDSEIIAEEYLIEYLVVTESNVELGAKQEVILGIGCDEIITDAVFTYHNQQTGEVFQQQYKEFLDGALLFELNFASQEQTGIYQLDSVSFKVQDSVYCEDFIEAGIEAVFGVNQEIIPESDAIIEEDRSTEVEMEIVRIDEDGNIISENSMEDAMSHAIASQPALMNEERTGNIVVVLDPGHDNTHAGAQQNGLSEEDLNIKIAAYCKEELEEYNGVTVYLTRTLDGKCPHPGTTTAGCNEKRVAYAKSVGADIYVSLHNNSSSSKSAHGGMVFYPNKNYNSSVSETGKGLAQKIQDRLVALGIYDRGISVKSSLDNTTYPDGSLSDYYGVIRNSKLAGMPAIIVEHAFMSNASDVNNFLNSDEKLKKLGVADATAIADYYELSKTINVTVGSIQISDVNNNTGTASMSVSKVAPSNKIDKVSFAVWSASDQSDLVWYDVPNDGTGNYKAVLNINKHKYNYGKYNIDVYAYDIYGNKYYLGGKNCTFTAPKEKITVDGNNKQTSYKITVTGASTTGGVKEVKAAVWSKTNGQDDLIWYQMKQDSSGVYAVDIPIKNHKTVGIYYVDVYVVSNSSTSKYFGGKTFEVVAASAEKIEIINQNNKTGTFDVKLTGVKSLSGISKVQVPIWSKSNQSDLHWYTAEKQSDGSYVVHMNIANHKYNYGKYHADAYVTDGNGIRQYVGGKTISINILTPKITATTNTIQTNYTLSVSGVEIQGGIKSVRFAVWSKANGQDDLKWYTASKSNSGTWTADVAIKNHKNIGVYYVDTYVVNGSDSSIYLVGTTFNVSAVSVEQIGITNKSDTTGTFDVIISGIKSPSGISKVQVPVWSKSNQSDLYWYTAEKQSDGSYIAHVDIGKHKYNYGTYYADVYVTMGNEIRQCVGGKKVTMNVPKATVTAIGNSNQTNYSLKVSGVGIPGGVKAVKFAVWSKVNGQDDLKWYTASNAGKGIWKADVKVSAHKTTGVYYVDTYAIDMTGKSVYLAGTTFSVSAVSVEKIEITNKSDITGTFDVVVTGIKSLSGISKVQVPVWSKSDQSDLCWYTAEKQSDGSYIAHVDIAKHKYNYGTYYADVYVTMENEIRQYVGGKKATVNVPKTTVTATGNTTQTTYSLKASGVGIQGGVKSVKFAVWSKTNGQDDLKWYTASNAGKGTWKADMKVSTHKTAGVYYVDTYATDISGKSVYMGGTTFKVDGPSASKVALVNYKEADGTFGVQASGVKSTAGIASVRVAVWSSGNQSDLLWYDATQNSDGTYRIGADVRNHDNNTGKYYADVYITDNNGIRSYAGGVSCSIVKVTNILHPLMGSNSVTIAQMVKYYNSNATYPSFYASTEASTIEDFCRIYLEECRAEGVKAEVAFCQAMKETAFLKFGGNVSITQFNFAGIGSTGAGVAGESYSDIRTGIRAQVQHLKAYGSTEALNRPCVDTRFSYVSRNTAPYVEWLGIQENPSGKGWATAKNYGYDIVSMVNKLKMY